ncbi:MAG: D-alanine--D-alanine ligase [Clostridia bacterium]|nr:D-alanine--D-alanine ligase [Clostridia bacterium]
MNGKINLCVLFGGQSPEHKISCKSAASVIHNLHIDRYNLQTIGITKEGAWYLYTGDVENIAEDSWEEDTQNLKRAFISPDACEKAIYVFEESGAYTKIYPDVVFPVLHGEHGEDGTMQGLLELANLKYVGTGVPASANCMDKTFTKILLKDAGIPQAEWVTIHTNAMDRLAEKVAEIESKLGYPCFVKPATTGSSVGVGKAYNREQLESAIKEAAAYARKILVEEHIDGREVECSVLGNQQPVAGEVGEIMPTVDFYDFDAKYNDNTTKLQIPAQIPEEIREQIRQYALDAFVAVDGSGLSRVDFFIRNSDGTVVINEINTMPGFTNISMYPKLWEAVGLKYADLLDQLILLALEGNKQ